MGEGEAAASLGTTAKDLSVVAAKQLRGSVTATQTAISGKRVESHVIVQAKRAKDFSKAV